MTEKHRPALACVFANSLKTRIKSQVGFEDK